MSQQKFTVSVIGGHDCTEEVDRLSEKVGEIVAKVGCVLVCGGLGGVMEAVSRGAKKAGGLTIGLLPGNEKQDANPFIDIALPTSMGYSRNAMVACSADAIIAMPGSWGTSCEISYGMVYKRPVLDMGNWNKEHMIPINSLEELETQLKNLVAQKQQASEKE